MKKIILACSAGMSTSIVVSKMKAAIQSRGEEIDVYAIPEGAIADELATSSEGVIAILLGPQVRFIKQAITNTAKPYGIPVDVIDTRLYGTANGEKILDHALQLAQK
ncbi:PTS sugar transporter subunit IIB [Bacillaceae bacterium Marseille-Q3522]|nr:PTS sugar transporter subunit IIB [Bacillaceae bacterium Marseille-Q3522]